MTPVRFAQLLVVSLLGAVIVSLFVLGRALAQASGPGGNGQGNDCPPGYVILQNGQQVWVGLPGESSGPAQDNPLTYPVWVNGDMYIYDCALGASDWRCALAGVVEYQATVTYCAYLASQGIDCHTFQPLTPPVGNPGPSYTVISDIDAPPQCASIGVTEDGMACYPTCTTAVTEGGVACLDVRREPYPRGLVGVPNVFALQGPYAKEGNTAACPDPNLQYPLYRNRTLQVVWEMDVTIPPAWFFDERQWNISKGVSNQGFGYEVEHTFETSSFPTFDGDKPYVGPSTTNELLPAYLVRVDTWWIGYVVREWDEYFWYEEYEEVSCTYNPGAPDHDPACSPNGKKSVLKPGFPEYRFRGHMVSKDQIDLRTWGWPTSKLYSRHAWDSRQSVVGIPPQYICRYVPTPILESQAVIATDGNP